MAPRILALVALWLPAALWPQSPSLFKADVNLVIVPCLVTDPQGTAMPGLGVDDFRLFDNEVQQQLTYFTLENDLPLTVFTIIDVSESQRHSRSANRRAVDKFLERTIRSQDRAFVAEVAERTILRSEVSGGPYGLREHLLLRREELLGEPCPILRGKSLCGGSALWESVYSVGVMMQHTSGNKALVLLSDGNDTGSIHTLSAAVDAVRRAEAFAYCIKLPDLASQLASTGLATLAAETGGIAFNASEEGIDLILSRVETDLRSRYILGFQSTPSDDHMQQHKLRAEVLRPASVVHMRTEYLKPPAGRDP